MLDLRAAQETEIGLLETNVSDLLVQPVSVLIVDDHALVRSAISLVLTSRPEVKLVIVAPGLFKSQKRPQ